jgi:hypothetical protein
VPIPTGVISLSAASPRRSPSSLSKSVRNALATLAGQDQHALGVLQARRAVAALNLGADLLDLLLVLRAAFLALEHCYARAHRTLLSVVPVHRTHDGAV